MHTVNIITVCFISFELYGVNDDMVHTERTQYIRSIWFAFFFDFTNPYYESLVIELLLFSLPILLYESNI